MKKIIDIFILFSIVIFIALAVGSVINITEYLRFNQAECNVINNTIINKNCCFSECKKCLMVTIDYEYGTEIDIYLAQRSFECFNLDCTDTFRIKYGDFNKTYTCWYDKYDEASYKFINSLDIWLIAMTIVAFMSSSCLVAYKIMVNY